MTLGEKLYQRRLELGLSQSQVAGEQITRNMLSQLEHDQASPSVKTLTYLANVLQVRISWLLEEDERLPDVSVIGKARECFGQKAYRTCMELLQDLQEPTEESVLLLHRSSVKYAENCLFDGKNSEAWETLRLADKLNGLYLSTYDCFSVKKLLFACALAEHKQMDELASEIKSKYEKFEADQDMKLLWVMYYLQKALYQDAMTLLCELSDQSCSAVLYLRGLLLYQIGEQEAAVTVLEQVEQKDGLPRQWKQQLFHILEQHYASRGNYQLAYRYAVLRME